MGEMFQVREATSADYEAVNQIVKEGQDEHAEALPDIFCKIDVVMPWEYFDSLVESTETCFYVAEAGDEIVGFAITELMSAPPFDSLVQRKYAYVNDFGVKQTQQKKGIGRQLFAASAQWAKEQGASSLELNVWEFNRKAIRFYEALGMESVSRKMRLELE